LHDLLDLRAYCFKLGRRESHCRRLTLHCRSPALRSIKLDRERCPDIARPFVYQRLALCMSM
jgi:hypothetical protein